METNKYRVVRCNAVDERCYHPLDLALQNAQQPTWLVESLYLTLWRMFREAGWGGGGDIDCFFVPPDSQNPGGTSERIVIFHASYASCSLDWLAIPPGFQGYIPVDLDDECREEESPIRIMRRWFFANFENPIENTPWDNEDKEYHFVFGRSVNAEDVLFKKFSGCFCGMDIRALVDEVEQASFEWAPRDMDPEYLQCPWTEGSHEGPPPPRPRPPMCPVDPDFDVPEEDDKPF